MQTKKIDIIIPVYNAFEDLKLCVESLKKHVNFNLHRILLIDDKSPDERVLPYLKTLESDCVIVKSNASNLGFSATINMGIAYSDRDVILLNTDTIVTKNFIEKIVNCAYADRSIATVAPLSNNASICSVPNYNEDNKLPENLSVDNMADLVDKCSLHKYPNIPTAIGFCMFIKRTVINEVGLFDAQTFGKGYGEENDFCFRAQQMGYHHVMCDDTFVYHSGTVSFASQEKKQLIAEHEQILAKKYSAQVHQAWEYILGFANKEIADNIGLHMSLKNNKKNILYLVHSDFREDTSANIGGTQFHVRDLTNQLKDDYNIYVAARDGSYLRVTAYIEEKRTSFQFFIGEKEALPMLFNEKLKGLFENIIGAFSIDLVHIHHTLGIGLDLYEVAKQHNIPLFATLHDLYYICPTLKLLDTNNQVCTGNESCNACMQQKLSIHSGEKFIEKWQKEHGNVLSFCDKIFFPSENTKSIFSHYYTDIKENLMVISHGLDEINANKETCTVISNDSIQYVIEHLFTQNQHTIDGWAYVPNCNSQFSTIYLDITDSTGKQMQLLCQKISRLDVALDNLDYEYSGFSLSIPYHLFSNGMLTIKIQIENKGDWFSHDKIICANYKGFRKKENMHVAFIGGMCVEKGSDTAYTMIKHAQNGPIFHIFGGIGVANLYLLENENLVKTGWYTPQQLPMLFQQYEIDIVCILSICPETFCYTLSESLACHIPVIVTDIGALGERVKEMDCGWVVPLESSGDSILSLLNTIWEDKEQYEEKLKNIQNLSLKTALQMADEYRCIYEQYLKMEIAYNAYDANLIFDGYLLGTGEDCSYADKEIYTQLKLVENQLKSIQSSVTYRLLLKLSVLKIPFRSQLKKLVLNSYQIAKKFKRK